MRGRGAAGIVAETRQGGAGGRRWEQEQAEEARQGREFPASLPARAFRVCRSSTDSLVEVWSRSRSSSRRCLWLLSHHDAPDEQRCRHGCAAVVCLDPAAQLANSARAQAHPLDARGRARESDDPLDVLQAAARVPVHLPGTPIRRAGEPTADICRARSLSSSPPSPDAATPPSSCSVASPIRPSWSRSAGTSSRCAWSG